MPDAVVAPSPAAGKKWRATLPDGATVDFGQAGAADYTTHGDAHRMARYVRRHGGAAPAAFWARLAAAPAPAVRRAARGVARSTTEAWDDPRTPGFWARWLLWSEPSWAAAAARVRAVSGLRVVAARRPRTKR